MLTIKVDTPDVDAIAKGLDGFKKQVPFIVKTALNETAKDVIHDERLEMRRVFDRPTRFTYNSLFMKGATKAKPESVVWLREITTLEHHYLEPNIFGGTREQKRSEKLLQRRGKIRPGQFIVPGGGVRLDSYGNVSRGQVQQVLSGLGAQFDRLNNETARSKARKRRKGDRGYFAVVQRNRRLRPGVYKRLRKRVRPIFITVNRARYPKRYDFFGVAQRSINQNLPGHMDRSLKKALETAWPDSVKR